MYTERVFVCFGSVECGGNVFFKSWNDFNLSAAFLEGHVMREFYNICVCLLMVYEDMIWFMDYYVT